MLLKKISGRMLYKVADNLLDRAVNCLERNSHIWKLSLKLNINSQIVHRAVLVCIKYGEVHRSGKAKTNI